MFIPELSETTLRRNANVKSFERGQAYYESGAVIGVTQRGNTLQAAVEGNEADLETGAPHRGDPAPFRREVRQILRHAVDGWESGWDDDSISVDLQTLVNKAQDFTEAGDANNALVVLAAISEACVDYWDDVAEYGVDSDEAVELLDHAWAEAILSAELTAAAKTDLQAKLQAWQDQLDGTFAMGLEALRQGWDYPPLQQVLQGHITELGVWDGEAPDYADELALIRLKILDRQGRYQEYLHLAEAESQTEQYLTICSYI